MFEKVVVLALVGACGSNPAGPHVLMDFSREHSLYDAPVPADDLRPSTVAQVSLPNPETVGLVDQMTGLLADNDGFAATGGVFFQISTTIDASNLPAITQFTVSLSHIVTHQWYLVIAFLVILPLALFLMLLSRG